MAPATWSFQSCHRSSRGLGDASDPPGGSLSLPRGEPPIAIVLEAALLSSDPIGFVAPPTFFPRPSLPTPIPSHGAAYAAHRSTTGLMEADASAGHRAKHLSKNLNVSRLRRQSAALAPWLLCPLPWGGEGEDSDRRPTPAGVEVAASCLGWLGAEAEAPPPPSSLAESTMCATTRVTLWTRSALGQTKAAVLMAPMPSSWLASDSQNSHITSSMNWRLCW